MKLKLATYNICHCKDFSNAVDKNVENIVKVEQTAEVIKRINADVIGLNEVYDYGNEKEYFKQTKRLANLGGYNHFKFAESYDCERCNIGNSILSRYPILAYSEYNIPTLPKEEQIDKSLGYEPRVLAVADIDVNGSVLRVVSSHFGLVDFELKSIVKKACEIIDASNVPIVLMGDFNAKPDDERIKPIYDRLISAAKVMDNNEFTFASYNPFMQIDYIFLPKTAKVISYTVHKERASDHFPISADVEI